MARIAAQGTVVCKQSWAVGSTPPYGVPSRVMRGVVVDGWLMNGRVGGRSVLSQQC